MTRSYEPAFSGNLYEPFASVPVPVLKPFTEIFAKGKSSFVDPSLTVPEMECPCGKATRREVSHRRAKQTAVYRWKVADMASIVRVFFFVTGGAPREKRTADTLDRDECRGGELFLPNGCLVHPPEPLPEGTTVDTSPLDIATEFACSVRTFLPTIFLVDVLTELCAPLRLAKSF